MSGDSKDSEKCRRIVKILPKPLALVHPMEGITKLAQTLELQGGIVVAVTFSEFSDNADLEDLSKAKFWPQNRVPYGWGESSVGGDD